MTISINAQTTIHEVEQQFRKEYPFLKIEFTNKPHKFGEVYKNGHWYNNRFKLSSIGKRPITGTIDIKPWKKAGEVEEEFRDKFKLNAQIFRKDGYEWIQTAGSDSLTLFEQNEMARKSIEKAREDLWFNSTCLL